MKYELRIGDELYLSIFSSNSIIFFNFFFLYFQKPLNFLAIAIAGLSFWRAQPLRGLAEDLEHCQKVKYS